MQDEFSVPNRLLCVFGIFFGILENKEIEYCCKIQCWGWVQGNVSNHLWTWVDYSSSSGSSFTPPSPSSYALWQQGCSAHCRKPYFSWADKASQHWLPLYSWRGAWRFFTNHSCFFTETTCRFNDKAPQWSTTQLPLFKAWLVGFSSNLALRGGC